MKKLLLFFLAATLFLGACGENANAPDKGDAQKNEQSEEKKEEKQEEEKEEKSEEDRNKEEDLGGMIKDLKDFDQFGEVKKGDTIALMKTSMGDIKIRLFPEVAPKAVENFTTHAKNGYYNGLTFHRVIDNFMIQGGDPLGTGEGGESIWKAPFEDEFAFQARNYRGALSMANSGPATNGSQFFIVQAKDIPEKAVGYMKDAGEQQFPEDVTGNYNKMGGTPWLDFRHTVFGQVIEGMDIVDKIVKVEKDKEYKPLEDVKIQSIDISEVQ